MPLHSRACQAAARSSHLQGRDCRYQRTQEPAAGHVGRDLRLPHRGQPDLVHCMMRIDPTLHVVGVVLVHLIGPLRRDDVPVAEILIVATVKIELSARCCTYPACSQDHRAGRVAITIYDPARVVGSRSKKSTLIRWDGATLISCNYGDTRVLETEICLAVIPFSRTGIIGRNRHGIAVDQGHRGGDSMRAARECQQQERAGKIEASVTFHARENASSFFNAASTLTLWKFVKDNNLY